MGGDWGLPRGPGRIFELKSAVCVKTQTLEIVAERGSPEDEAEVARIMVGRGLETRAGAGVKMNLEVRYGAGLKFRLDPGLRIRA